MFTGGGVGSGWVGVFHLNFAGWSTHPENSPNLSSEGGSGEGAGKHTDEGEGAGDGEDTGEGEREEGCNTERVLVIKGSI